MSICAITTGDQDCKAVVNLLRQDIVLDADKDYDASFIDLVVENQKGVLNYIEIYFPYKIFEFENRTYFLLDENNKYQYRNKYKIDLNLKKVKLEIKRDYEFLIKEIELLKQDTSIGSLIKVVFKKPLNVDDRCGIRILFSCEPYSQNVFDNVYLVSLNYYITKYTIPLNLREENVLSIENFFLHIVLPPNITDYDLQPGDFKVNIYNEEQNKYYLPQLNFLYGPKADKYFSQLPRSTAMLFRYLIDNEPVFKYCESFPISCTYRILESEEIFSPDKKVIMEGKNEYARMWTNDAEPEGKNITIVEKNNVLDRRHEYNLLIIKEETSTNIYINGEKTKILRGKLTYRILSYVLKYKGTGGTAWNIAKHVWSNEEVIEYGDLREYSKALKYRKEIEKGKKQESEDIVQDVVSRYSRRISRRIIDVNNFLEPLKTKLEANDQDEYQFTKPIIYCLIEKII